MSTNSRISIIKKNEKISSIYCNWEGFPQHQGAMLLEHYNSEEKAKEIIALGDLSILNAQLYPSEKHSFADPQGGVTIAYHRDRKEKLRIAKHRTLAEYEKSYLFDKVNYNYLWSGKWLVFDKYGKKKWLELTENIVKYGL